MKVNSEFTKPSNPSKVSKFTESLANAFDTESLLNNDPVFKTLYMNRVINSLSDYTQYLLKLKLANIHLTGKESAIEIHSKLMDKLNQMKQHRNIISDKLKSKIFDDNFRIKELFIECLIEFGIEDVDADYFTRIDTHG